MQDDAKRICDNINAEYTAQRRNISSMKKWLRNYKYPQYAMLRSTSPKYYPTPKNACESIIHNLHTAIQTIGIYKCTNADV